MGIGPLTVPSAKAEITFPRADKDLLIFFASSRTAPSAPVLLTYQREEENSELALDSKNTEEEIPTHKTASGEVGADVNPPGMQGKMK